MTEADIVTQLSTYPGVFAESAYGSTFLFVNPERRLRDNVPYFASVDGEPARLHLGLGKDGFARAVAAGLTPHETYGRQHWITVASPDLPALADYVAEAYRVAHEQFEKRLARQERETRPL